MQFAPFQRSWTVGAAARCRPPPQAAYTVAATRASSTIAGFATARRHPRRRLGLSSPPRQHPASSWVQFSDGTTDYFYDFLTRKRQGFFPKLKLTRCAWPKRVLDPTAQLVAQTAEMCWSGLRADKLEAQRLLIWGDRAAAAACDVLQIWRRRVGVPRPAALVFVLVLGAVLVTTLIVFGIFL